MEDSAADETASGYFVGHQVALSHLSLVTNTPSSNKTGKIVNRFIIHFLSLRKSSPE